MRTPQPRLILIAVSAALAACATAPKPQPPLAGPLQVSVSALAALPALSGFNAPCLGVAMYASSAVPVGATDEARQKAYYENDVYAFINVKGQSEYVSCLEKDKSSDDYAKNHDDARKSLAWAQGEVEKYQAFFPAAKRIVDTEQTFGDVDALTGVQHLVVSLQDGSKIASEHTFPKSIH